MGGTVPSMGGTDSDALANDPRWMGGTDRLLLMLANDPRSMGGNDLPSMGGTVRLLDAIKRSPVDGWHR
jgi:hypothetical protein